MKAQKQLYITLMIGFGKTKRTVEIYDVYMEINSYQFLFFEYSVCKYCKIK